MTFPEQSRRSRIVLAIAVMGLAALFAAMMLAEWFPIVVTRSPARIASYHFGSASTTAHGGWKYSNPEVFAWSAFAEAMAAVATMPVLWMIIVRRSRRAVIGLVAICAVYLVASLVLGEMKWATRSGLSQEGWPSGGGGQQT
jgi:hypothetical protein